MTFANIGHLGVQPGKRDELIRLLTRPGGDLAELGCLLYEVGYSDDEPDRVYVAELWTSAEAHHASLGHPSVRAAIAEAMPLLTDDLGGTSFEVVGSPLRPE